VTERQSYRQTALQTDRETRGERQTGRETDRRVVPRPRYEGVGVAVDVGVEGHGTHAARGAPADPRLRAGAHAPGPDVAVGAAAVDGAAAGRGGEAADALAAGGRRGSEALSGPRRSKETCRQEILGAVTREIGAVRILFARSVKQTCGLPAPVHTAMCWCPTQA
jgi:hypothetical protein